MEKELVIIHKDEPRASTWSLKDGFQVEHRALIKLIKKYKIEFEEFGNIASEVQYLKTNAASTFLLNEDQALYLGTLLKNSEHVRTFKRKLISQFSKCRKLLLSLASQRQNAEWLETRNTGKEKRRIETDTIQRFVAYAVAQGSHSAERYYVNISKMQNKSLFFIEQKFKNIRDILNLQQLSIVICADEIVSKALEDGMTRKLNYKEIYQLAKTRIESFAEIHGKTLIPTLLLEQSNNLLKLIRTRSVRTA